MLNLRIKSSKDLVAGLLFIGIAAIFAVGLRELAIGSAFRMGPGYFPMVLIGLLAVLGIVIALRGFTIDGAPLGDTPWNARLAFAVPIALVAVFLYAFGYRFEAVVAALLLIPTLLGLPWRGLLLIIVPITFFGATLRGLGLIPALTLTVFATTLASHHFKLWVAVMSTLVLVTSGWLIFIWGLRLPLPLFGPWIGGY